MKVNVSLTDIKASTEMLVCDVFKPLVPVASGVLSWEGDAG